MLKWKDLPFAIAVASFLAILVALLWLYPWPSYPGETAAATHNSAHYINPAVSRAGEIGAYPSGSEYAEKTITDWWIVRLTTGLVVAGFIQFGMFWLQLRAMRKGVEDAGEAAGAAKSTAEAAAKQINLARDDFNATHRPWIALMEAMIVSPLTWDARGNASLSINFTVKNVGHSPALHVFILSKVYAALAPSDTEAQQAAFKNNVRMQSDQTPWGYTLFPGQEISQPVTITIAASDIASMRNKAGSPTMFLEPAILGFIEYRFTFGPSESHFTQFIYNLKRISPNGLTFWSINEKSGDLPSSDLRLITWISGWHAD